MADAEAKIIEAEEEVSEGVRGHRVRKPIVALGVEMHTPCVCMSVLRVPESLVILFLLHPRTQWTHGGVDVW